MSHLILAKMVQVYHARKVVAFDCSGRFGGTSLNDKARQLSCYKGQTRRIDLWVFLVKFESRLSADITNYERAISPNYEIVTDAH